HQTSSLAVGQFDKCKMRVDRAQAHRGGPERPTPRKCRRARPAHRRLEELLATPQLTAAMSRRADESYAATSAKPPPLPSSMKNPSPAQPRRHDRGIEPRSHAYRGRCARLRPHRPGPTPANLTNRDPSMMRVQDRSGASWRLASLLVLQDYGLDRTAADTVT